MWYNAIIRAILRSPLHGLLSGSIMLVNYRGRRSGKAYNVPVNYLRQGEGFAVVSQRERVWWRNFRHGGEATLRVRGRDLPVRGEAIENEAAVMEALGDYFQAAPQYARYFQIGLDAQGEANPQDLARAARERVVIRFERV